MDSKIACGEGDTAVSSATATNYLVTFGERVSVRNACICLFLQQFLYDLRNVQIAFEVLHKYAKVSDSCGMFGICENDVVEAL